MTSSGRASAAIAWRPWSGALFTEARARRVPVLLSLTTSWSEGSSEMHRTTFTDAAVVSAVNDTCLAVRVDADERPDLAERYALGGFPTTVFLTPDGFVVGGGTLIPAEALCDALPRVRDAIAGVEPASHRAFAAGSARSTPDFPALERWLAGAFDAEHGGVGGAPKFPHAAAVAWALDRSAGGGDPFMRDLVTRALDGIGWGELYDEHGGGFYRCCRGAGWTDPQREKLLAVNAALLDLYVRAGAQTGTDRWLGRAADTLAFIQHSLRRHDGAWRNASGSTTSRVFCDANAGAVSAALQAASVFGDDDLARQALGTLEHVLLASYVPGEGVAHFAGGPRGLLADQIAMAAACLDAWEATGDLPYRMMAEELAHFATRTMWDEQAGGFFDRAAELYADEPVGASDLRKPFVQNCAAASLLGRLAEAAPGDEWLPLARKTLEAVAPAVTTQGPDVAHYLIARRAVPR
ncbi:MAG TPA: DUF255 domain-containing protein [Vicinamibacterales bacterium]|nr:DUF255 domain-containing protein [Vicinamibacterales bacterium]